MCSQQTSPRIPVDVHVVKLKLGRIPDDNAITIAANLHIADRNLGLTLNVNAEKPRQKFATGQPRLREIFKNDFYRSVALDMDNRLIADLLARQERLLSASAAQRQALRDR